MQATIAELIIHDNSSTTGHITLRDESVIRQVLLDQINKYHARLILLKYKDTFYQITPDGKGGYEKRVVKNEDYTNLMMNAYATKEQPRPGGLSVEEKANRYSVTYLVSGQPADVDAWYERLCNAWAPQGYGTRIRKIITSTETLKVIDVSRGTSCD